MHIDELVHAASLSLPCRSPYSSLHCGADRSGLLPFTGTVDAAATALQPLALDGSEQQPSAAVPEVAALAETVPPAGGRGSGINRDEPTPAPIPAEHRISIASRSDASAPGPPPVRVADDREFYDPGRPPAQHPAAHRISIAYSSASSAPAMPSVDHPQDAAAGGRSSGVGGLPPGFSLPISWGPPIGAFHNFAQEPARVAGTVAAAMSLQPPVADQSGQRMETVASAQPVPMNGTSGDGHGMLLARQTRCLESRIPLHIAPCGGIAVRSWSAYLR
jgi:hypothetical protein